ncbi:hypothetical protein DCCM_4055 [Desulfocucumis palustris]|uniref:Uncharacterized protein n=1 Tax=Desulfocucumis palustris TaxID=1898651 RepID=A0A2L2XFC7_9FIRM|nr:hypothetical protein DCCM_4055 [Desulfocucumis palustris]
MTKVLEVTEKAIKKLMELMDKDKPTLPVRIKENMSGCG